MNTSADLISILIVNFNGMQWLKNCLDSLQVQTYKNFEIILVDNASNDASVLFVEKNFPEVKIVQSGANLGFAGGNNIGYKHVKGKFILLLNNDTTVESDYLENFCKAFSEIPNLGSAQSRILRMNDTEKIDVCGSYWTSSTFLYHYGYGKEKNNPAYAEMLPFFSNNGASMMLRREALEKVGFFDDDFWCYYEETDLCNRLWLAGYECWYYPAATCYHAGGGTSLRFNNDYIQFHNFKNKLLSFLKNFEKRTLMCVVPIYGILNIGISVAWLAQGKPRHFFSLYKAMWWNVVHLRSTLQKRGVVQGMRVKSDKEIFKMVKKNPRVSYYRDLFQNNLQAYED